MRSRFEWVNRCFLILLLIEIPSGSSVTLQAQKSDSSTKAFALVGARIYPAPGAKPIVNGVIVVAGGKIGLWNAHVHLMEPKWDHAGKSCFSGSASRGSRDHFSALIIESFSE